MLRQLVFFCALAIAIGANLYQAIERDAHAAVSTPYPLALSTSAVALTADDQAVVTSGVAILTLSSDNATGANRTMVLGAGITGQIMVIYWNDTDEGELADSGTAAIAGAWVPTNVGETMTLLYNGSVWIELSRAAAS